MSHLLVVKECLNGSGVPFVKRSVPESGIVKPEGKTASPGKEFDGFKAFHGFI
jgi:hypothetical protein